jgi:DNA-directed RNA polymerase specialized sigma24 family protein
MTNDLALLNRLFSSPESGEIAWKEFLREYSHLFLKIIWQFEKDHDDVMEKYLYVCSKFAEKDFAILRRFTRQHGENPPKFTTWLGAVVRNMCIDAYRSAEGRRRIPKALLRLPDLDKKVFELYYWRGFGLEEIEQQLRASRNGSRESIAEILERIEGILLRPPSNPSIDPMSIRLSYNDENIAIGAAVEPVAIDQETLDRWLSRLSTDERLLIQLKFWDDLSIQEVGQVLKISSEERILELLRGALKNLRTVAEKERLRKA